MIARVVAALLITVTMLALAACDPGMPTADEQMRSMGLPVESAMQVNEETVATVRMNAGSAELLIFTPDRFGGDELHTWPAEPSTSAGGQIGNGYSLVPEDDTRTDREPGICYVFGAAQGAVDDIVADDPTARGQVVNPEIGGWVIVMPESGATTELEWQLIASAGDVIYSGRGFPGSSFLCRLETE